MYKKHPFENNKSNNCFQKEFYMNKVEISGVNTAKLPLLTAEEKKELLKKVHQGDQTAREKFINGNLRLVLSIIKRFYARGENLDDLFQVGCVGLIKAMDNFDMEQNVQFSTYAVPMIIGEIKRYLRDNNSIRVSRSVREIAYKALAIQDRIRREENRDARIEEIANELKISKEEIAMSLDAIQEPISLQEPAYIDSNDTINVMDQISDKKNTDDMWTESLTIAQMMQNLNEKEKSIISKRYFEGRTQMEIADEIGISQAQVSRLEKDAIKHMRRLYK